MHIWLGRTAGADRDAAGRSSHPRLRTRSFAALLVLTAAVAALAACASRGPVASPCAVQPTPAANAALLRKSEDRPQAPFSVSLVPTVPVPIRIGTQLGFQLSSDTAGYASFYVIDPVYDVQILAENLPVPAGNIEYPASQGFILRAVEPVGFNRAILLVTRQPFAGFSGDDTLTAPVSTALDGAAFVRQLNGATRRLPPSSWAADEVCLRVVG